MKERFADWAAQHELNFIVGSSSCMSPHTTHWHLSPQVSMPPLPPLPLLPSLGHPLALHHTSISCDDMLPSYSPHRQNSSSTFRVCCCTWVVGTAPRVGVCGMDMFRCFGVMDVHWILGSMVCDAQAVCSPRERPYCLLASFFLDK